MADCNSKLTNGLIDNDLIQLPIDLTTNSEPLFSPNILSPDPNLLIPNANGPSQMNGHAAPYSVPPPPRPLGQPFQRPPPNIMGLPVYSSPYFMGLSYLTPQYIVPTVVRAPPAAPAAPQASPAFVYPTRQPYFFCAPNVSTNSFLPKQQNIAENMNNNQNFYMKQSNFNKESMNSSINNNQNSNFNTNFNNNNNNFHHYNNRNSSNYGYRRYNNHNFNGNHEKFSGNHEKSTFSNGKLAEKPEKFEIGAKKLAQFQPEMKENEDFDRQNQQNLLKNENSNEKSIENNEILEKIDNSTLNIEISIVANKDITLNNEEILVSRDLNVSNIDQNVDNQEKSRDTFEKCDQIEDHVIKNQSNKEVVEQEVPRDHVTDDKSHEKDYKSRENDDCSIRNSAENEQIIKQSVEQLSSSRDTPITAQNAMLYSDRVAKTKEKSQEMTFSKPKSGQILPKNSNFGKNRPPKNENKWKNSATMNQNSKNFNRQKLDTQNKDDFPSILEVKKEEPIADWSKNDQSKATNDQSKLISDQSKSTEAPPTPSGKSWASLFKNSAQKDSGNNTGIIPNPDNVQVSTKPADSVSLNGDNKSVTSESTIASQNSAAKSPDIVLFGSVNPIANAFRPATNQISRLKPNGLIENDEEARKIGLPLQSYQLVHRGSPYQLRGLINAGNWCYVNSTLQALIACPPFVHMLRDMQILPSRPNSSTPTLDALIKFAAEFSDKTVRRGPQDLDIGSSFTPFYVYDLLDALNKDSTSFKGRQEDAEEFLNCVLNNLHEEMTNCINYSVNAKTNNSYDNSDDEDLHGEEWKQVGPNKKAVVTRSSKMITSPVANIFSGLLRITVQQPASKTSANLESFFVLPLDIQSDEIVSINDALHFMHKECIKVMKGKSEIRVTRWTTFQELPAVLILQLKYFVVSNDGQIKKLLKPIEYGMDLQIDRNLVSLSQNAKMNRFSRSYKLCAVIYHHGHTVEKGHYTVNIFHGGFWVNIDDEKIAPVEDSYVLGGQKQNLDNGRVPYLLFYRRCDIISSDNSNFSRRN